MSAAPASSGSPSMAARATADAATRDQNAPLLDVRGLSIFFKGEGGEVQATRDISFSIRPGERVGMVGESGCGKSVTGLSLLRLLPERTARIEGRIDFEGRNLLDYSQAQMREIRGPSIGMIFQEPMSALDPVFTIGEQIAETFRCHESISRREARERAVDALASVGIPSPERRVNEYPHQLSGGMRQRAMIAVALACKPKLLIADEPTTALDVTIQAQIIDLLLDLSERNGTALLFITHDLGVVAECCERLLTMYAGELVEDAPVDAALVKPLHPYTSGLLRSVPRLSPRKSALPSIPGRVPSLQAMPAGCRFEPRCSHADPLVCQSRQTLRDAGVTPLAEIAAQAHVAPAALGPADADALSPRRVRCARFDALHLPGAVA